MANGTAGNAGNPSLAGPIPEISILWITAGLGCDGDTIAMTAATQPSIEDIVRGGMPWIPKVNLHNPFLAYRERRRFPAALPSRGGRAARSLHSWWWKAPSPTRHNKTEGYWASLGTDRQDRPADH